MEYCTPKSHRRNVRSFIANLLTYLLVTSQFAPLTLGFDNLGVRTPDQNAGDVTRKQVEAPPSHAPVPSRLMVNPPAPMITATKTDSFADGDMDGKAEPGETITYSITIQNTGPDPALNLTLNDTVDSNTMLIGASVHSTPIGFNDAYNVLGNVRIQVPDGASDLLANDTDPENAGNSNAGLTITTLAGDNSAPFSGTSANGGQVTATTGDGSFQYNPPPGFTGTDTFTYTTTDSTGGGTSTATVTLTVTGMIWFVNASAPVGGDGRLTAPFNCYTGTSSGAQTCFSDTAADQAGHNIFLFSGNYIGGNTLLNNQRLIGQGATDTLVNLTGVTVPTFSDALPATGGMSPVITTGGSGINAVPLGQGNLLRGFTVGNTSGAKIFGNNFGMLTVGNNVSPDVTLNGTGQALNLTNGTFVATSAFSSVTTTSSTGQGILLSQIAGTLAFGSTTVSNSTTQGILVQQSTGSFNFGNTTVGTGVAGSGGTNGVSLQNNSMGTRTFGTLTIQNINGPANSAFLNAVGGGNTTAGTTNISGVAGTGHGIDIQSLAGGTSVTFGNTTVTKASPGSLVNLGGGGVGNAGNVTFLSLGGTNTNGNGLVGAENTGALTVTNNTGSLTTTLGPAINITKAAAPASPITLNFTNVSSTNSGSQGINLDRVSGTLNIATTTSTNPTNAGIQIQNSAGTFNLGNTNSSSSGGVGVFLNLNSAAITFADLDISPDATQRAFVATDNTGTLTNTSGDITTSGAGNRAVEIDGPAGRTPINLQFTSITTTGASNSISLIDVSGTKFQVTGTTQINTRAGTGVFVDNSTATNIQLGTTNIPNPNAAAGYGIRVEDSSSTVTVASATISDANQITAQSDGDSDGVPNTDGDGDGIFLTNNTGSFTLNGGTISNSGNDGIDLRNSATLVLSGVSISNPGQDVTGATGAGFGGHAISLHNLTGTSSITGGTISGFNVANRDGLYLVNTTSTALNLTIHGATFQNAIGNRGIGIQGRSAANMTVTVGGPTNNVATNCTFSNILATALQSTAGASAGSTATVNLTVQNSTFQNSPTDGKTNLIAGVAEAGRSTLLIQDNTFNNVFITASTGESLININNDGTLAGNQLNMTLQRNNINNVGSAANNCAGGAVACRGPLNAVLIFIDDAANVPSTLVVDNNTLTNIQQGGIFLDMANTGAPSSTVNAKIINNCIGRLRVGGACTGANAPVGAGAGITIASGIRVERRRNNSLAGNVLISGNVVRNGVGQNLGALNTPGIFTRTKANANLSATVTNNDVDTNLVGAPEMRFDTNANDVGDIIAPVQCIDISGNTFPAPANTRIIDINEINGTHNVEQASEAAAEAANGGVNVTPDAGVSFGVTCAAPPAVTIDPPQSNSQAEIIALGVGVPEQPVTNSQPDTSATSITSQPFMSLPRQVVVNTLAAKPEQSVVANTTPSQPVAENRSRTVGNQRQKAVIESVNGSQAGPAQDQSTRTKPTIETISPNPPVIMGNNVTWNVGTLPAGQSVTITFQVTVENPYSGPPQVSNQGTVTADGGISVLTDDPAVGGGADPTVTPIDVPPDVVINNAMVAEPTSGTTSMLFTVSLSTPASQMIPITFNTANGTAVAPGDYTAVAGGMITFQAGEQIKLIPITVNSDMDGAESDENFTVTISANPSQAIVVNATGTGTIKAANAAGTLLISELRTSGPNGAGDEFVEIYNNSDSPHTVNASDASPGYGVFKSGADCNATPVLVGTIMNGTVIPARGHYLLVGSAYSLSNYGGTGAAAGNATLTADIENDRNVSIFSTTNVLAVSTMNRFDAVGFGTNTGNVCDLVREGTNLGAVMGSTLQYSFFRKECDFMAGPGCTTPGTPKDTNDNTADFIFADTAATLVAGAGQRLGAPGPQNQTSPLIREVMIPVLLLDMSGSKTSPPNRVRDTTSDPGNNSTLGTLAVRRRVVNNTGGPVTRLRFRVVEITTEPAPGGVADLRARTSMTVMGVTVNDSMTCAATGTPMTPPCTVTVQGLTLEQPPAQAKGGGYNSTLTLTLGSPLPATASVNVEFLLGVQQAGSFRFFVIVEALP